MVTKNAKFLYFFYLFRVGQILKIFGNFNSFNVGSNIFLCPKSLYIRRLQYKNNRIFFSVFDLVFPVVRITFKFDVFVASFICSFLPSNILQVLQELKKKPEKIFISIFDDRVKFENFLIIGFLLISIISKKCLLKIFHIFI
jgi:hypothetical protein